MHLEIFFAFLIIYDDFRRVLILKSFYNFFFVAIFSAFLKGLMEFVTKMVAIMPHTVLETKVRNIWFFLLSFPQNERKMY